MNVNARIPWKSLLAQGAIIVASILAAFAVDAWWASRLNAATEKGHLEALKRDFEIAKERVTESLRIARRASEGTIDLSRSIREGTLSSQGRFAYVKIQQAIYYEVFSAPRGAYDAMVSAGQVELLRSPTLKQVLANFYGGLEDTRVSEQQLLRAVLDFQTSEVFANKVHWFWLGRALRNPEGEIPEKLKAVIQTWGDDVLLTNWLGVLVAHQDTVAEDYLFLEGRIDRILGLLTEELGRP